jgi:hypothetical protein
MPNLKPWYKVVTPREDLREGKPLDASEFAVHLDQVRDGRAPAVYQEPERFFERTYLTQNLCGLAAEVVRRLSGEKTETSAVFNMSTQFGGGKTHALTLLYHLGQNGAKANGWQGVNRLLEKSGMATVPEAATAVFVGTEFDSISGRGGDDGTPLRKTPWGEIAWQLGGKEALEVLAAHEKEMTAPAGDVIRRFLPKDRPCLILMDELMNYVSRSRKSGMAAQLYSFLQNLSEFARGQDNLVLAVSIPASEMEMNAEDQSDFERFKKLLDRLGKAVIMSAEAETSEIIRRRLFEWFGLPDDAKKTIAEYADWIVDHRQQVPNWFPIDNARDAFAATYPFHPTVLSVFERKWQALPRFQQTRGVLRMLALWVSKAYQEGYKGGHKDLLIGLGTAPLDDPMFRAALFEQLGESRLEGAVTTDICGKKDAFAVRLDNEAVDAIKKARLHRKIATAIFFESNGGQAKAEATVPEIRLAVAEPGLDIGNIETVLETLGTSCYYMSVERNRYRFSLSPNLNKLLADRRASIQTPKIDERVRNEIQKVFAAGSGVERVFYPEKSGQIPDRPALTFVVLPPDQSLQDDKKTTALIETMTKEYGTSARTFKSALVWCVPESASGLSDEARKVLAWEDIHEEEADLRLDDSQKRQLAENLKKAQRDLKESVWRTYKNLMLLGKDNRMRLVDLGLVHSSAADSMVTLVMNRLRQDGDVEEGVSPNFLVRNWPPAFKEWATKSVRDAFFASPQFPRLLNGEVVRDTIARGAREGILAYVGKTESGDYDPFIYRAPLSANDVELSGDVYVVTKETAEAYLKAKTSPSVAAVPGEPPLVPLPKQPPTPGVAGPTGDPGVAAPPEMPVTGTVAKLSWCGAVPAQKWMNFYTKVLSKFAGGKGLTLTVTVEAAPEGGISTQKIEEAKVALRELGLDDEIRAG